MLRASIFVATVFLAGCPSTRPEAPHIADDAPLRIRIARAEVKRAGGVAELVELSRSGDVHQRELALRGLGRVGGTDALAALEAALSDRDPKVMTAAAYAIGVLGSLDDLDEATQARLTQELVRLLPNDGAIEALGRVGDASGQGALAQCATTTAACDLALGRHGRRKIALSTEARTALVAATSSNDTAVRYAATYALSREHEPPADDAVNAALAARVADEDPEIRATAIAGLAKRKAIIGLRHAIEKALGDPDWRVQIEAVRALGGRSGDDAGRAFVARFLATTANEQVQAEGLRVIIANPDTPVDAFVDKPGWVGCLARAAVPGAATAATVDAIAKCSLPEHLKLPLLAERFDAARSDASYRRAALRILLAHEDPRVRAAGIGVLKDTWNDGDERSQATIVGTIASAIGTKNAIVAGTAIEAAPDIYNLLGANHPLRANLDAAIVSRAMTETDVDLSSSLYGVIAKEQIASGADACRQGLTRHAIRAKAAAECLSKLGEAGKPDPEPPQPPPADVASVIGRKLLWHLETSRGEIVIDLRPDVAPWAVATIVTLTERGFYDGIEFHRDVPNFVIQGGDPTMTGAGGPGFMIPAEPASSADGPGFVAGGVGIADAGRDSGGSQWFIMHSRAPHLDGRYTWIGSVVSGQKSADALLIGDKVVKATIERR